MKGIFSKLLLVILAMVVAMFAISCNNGGGTSESTSESESESVVESVSEPEEVPIVGAGENGEVNLGDALDLLAPVLDNDYITVSFTMDSSSTANQVKFATQTQATAYVKRTLSGYDVIATFVQMAETQEQMYPIATVTVYYVDGLAVFGVTSYSQQGVVEEWNKLEAATFNELINELNQMIAADEEALAAYGEVMKAVQQLEIILSEQETANVDIPMSFNLAEYANSALSFVLANKDDDMYSFLLETVYGVDVEDSDAVIEFEESFMAMLQANPTVAAVIDQAVASLNQTIMDNARADAEEAGVEFDESAVFQIDLEALCGLLQEKTGMSTADIIALIKSEFPELSDYLTDPEEGEGLYDYIYVRAQMITIDDLAKQISGKPDATALTLLGEVRTELLGITLGDLVNGVLNACFNTVAPDGDASTGEVTELEPIDYVAIAEETNLSLQALIVGFTFRTDAYGRPIELSSSNRVQASYINPETGLDTDIITVEVENSTRLTLSYGKILISFEIPQEVLDVAVDVKTKQ